MKILASLLRRTNLKTIIHEIQATVDQLGEMLTIIQLLELITAYNHAWHRGNIYLNLGRGLLVEGLVLEEQIYILHNVCAILRG